MQADSDLSAHKQKSPLNAGFSVAERFSGQFTEQWAGKFLTVIAAFICLLLLMPVAALIAESIADSFRVEGDSTFSELADTVLWQYILNSISVVLGAIIFACLLAVMPAWWCSHYEFKGRNILQWAMVFPLAIPAYISGYIYTELFDYAGPIQSSLRAIFNWQSPQDYWFPDFRSRWGASLMLALALYPYIYLLLRNAFARRSENLTNAARLMGASRRRIFFTIELPLARPALAIGCTLVAMESLADYGTVHLFAISTLTTAIYDSWLVYGSLTTAAKISCLMLLFVVLLVSAEKYQRRRQQFFEGRNQKLSATKLQASNGRTFMIWLVCGSIVIAGFVYPVLTLLDYTLTYLSENLSGNLWQHSQSTFMLAGSAAFIATLLALLFNAQLRFSPNRYHQSKLALSSLGYAIPGTVLAIGLLIPLTQADLWLNRLLVSMEHSRIGLFFSGTSFALIMAFVIRFAAISNGSIQSAYQHMPANLDAASQILGANRSETFTRIHWPLLRPAIISSLLLVFIECVKELPASLLLRPFDFETLATYVFQYASDEQLEQAALGALLIIVISLLPIVFLSRSQKMD